jgi:flagellar protein FlaI
MITQNSQRYKRTVSVGIELFLCLISYEIVTLRGKNRKVTEILVGNMGDTDKTVNKDNRDNTRRSIKIKVPRINFGTKKTSRRTLERKETIHENKKITWEGIKKIPHIDLVRNTHTKESKKATEITRIKLPLLKQDDELVAVEKDLESTFKTEKESAEPDFERKILKKLSLTTRRAFEDYDFEKHGSLVEITLEPPYKSKQEYWVEPGLAKVVIAYNVKSKLREYLLFEPELTPFEYELLERIHEDLRDVLILTDDELGIDRRKLLISKVVDLIEYYGLRIESRSLYKIEYYLMRNYLGWGRINALMNDPLLKIFHAMVTMFQFFCSIEENRT